MIKIGEFQSRSVSRKLIRIGIPVLAFITFAVNYSILAFQHKFGIGIDAYYYVLQLDSYTNNRPFYFPTNTPLALYTLVFANSIVNDSVLAVKICILIYSVSLLAAVFAITWHITGKYLCASFAILLVCISGLSQYLLVEYTSQLIALTFLFWSAFFFLKFSESRRFQWLMTALLSLGASILSHRSIVLITIGILVSYFLFQCLEYAKNGTTKYRIGTFFAFAIIMAAPVILKVQTLFSLPSYLNVEISSVPKFPSHFTTLPEIIILLVTVPLLLWFLVNHSNIIPTTGRYFLGTIAVWSLLITLNPFISSASGFLSIGGRIRTLAFLQVAFLLPSLLLIALSYSKKLMTGLLVFVLPLLLWSFFSPLPHGAQPEYLLQREKLITALKLNQHEIDDVGLVIADHGEQFVVTSITGKPSSQNFPVDAENYQNIFWLINGVPATMVDDKMAPLFKDSSGKETVLIRHDESWLKRLTSSDMRRNLISRNPHLFTYLKNR